MTPVDDDVRIEYTKAALGGLVECIDEASTSANYRRRVE
jgi:hypothetical protein